MGWSEVEREREGGRERDRYDEARGRSVLCILITDFVLTHHSPYIK